MPTYQYEAMNAQGEEIKDQLDALSTEEAISKIRGMGFFPTKIRERGARRGAKGAEADAAGQPRRARGANRKVKVKQLTQFTRQLSTLQDAGLPVLRSLRILEQQQKPGTPLKSVVRAVADDVEGGSTLSESMAQYPKAFNNLYTNMVAAGEAGGVLDLILQRLSDFMEKAEKLKAKIKGAMLYPICVIVIAVGIVLGIMTFVIPKFQEVFKDFGIKLPVPTQMLLDMSYWISKQFGWLYIILTPFILVVFFKLVRLIPAGKFALDWIVIRIPVLGNLVSKTSIARFTRTMGTLIGAGVPILEGLNITSHTAGNVVYQKALEKVHESIRRGETFAEPLRKARVCDSLVTNMIDVGEETGDLDKMMMKVADNYDDEVDTAVAALVSLLEPLLVIFLGGVCLFIILALFMPMVSMIEGVS